MRLADFNTLTFDCYGTLIDWESGLLSELQPWLERNGKRIADAAVLEAFGASEARAQAAAPNKPYPDILRDTMRALAARWDVAASPSELDRFAGSVGAWPAFPDSPAALQILKAQYRLAVLSNVDRASFRASNALLAVDFDHVFTAEEIGSYKPDLRNFEYALARLREHGVGASEVLHVAQSLFHDHAPAKRLGLASAWIDRRAGKAGLGATPPAAANPDWRFASLAELAAAVRGERKQTG